ncbi:MAG: hypothetical protein Q4D94_11565 [Bacillota bacterium]|nr:hypothetical protein [Bacillota bacterium]
MTVIGLFFPSFVSMALYMKLSRDTLSRWQTLIIRYGVYVLFNTLITQIVITYLLGISQVEETALKSFPFFVKYVLIALIWAVVLPFMEELLKKYIKVSIKISTDKENK